MKWVLFTGTWRLKNSEVEKDVREAVREVFTRGDGIVTGGAEGVDYYTMSEAMKLDPSASKIKVIIPASLETMIEDRYTNRCLPPITRDDVQALENILLQLREADRNSLIEMSNSVLERSHYYDRDTEEVRVSDEVYAFHVNESPGTQDTIDKAKAKGIPITVHKKYTL